MSGIGLFTSAFDRTGRWTCRRNLVLFPLFVKTSRFLFIGSDRNGGMTLLLRGFIVFISSRNFIPGSMSFRTGSLVWRPGSTSNQIIRLRSLQRGFRFLFARFFPCRGTGFFVTGRPVAFGLTFILLSFDFSRGIIKIILGRIFAAFAPLFDVCHFFVARFFTGIQETYLHNLIYNLAIAFFVESQGNGHFRLVLFPGQLLGDQDGIGNFRQIDQRNPTSLIGLRVDFFKKFDSRRTTGSVQHFQTKRVKILKELKPFILSENTCQAFNIFPILFIDLDEIKQA